MFFINLISVILVPFTHLFNEHRIKIMVLERGWVFAMKNALRLNIAPRVAPEPNLPVVNPENNVRGSKTFHVPMEIMRKYPRQQSVQFTSSTPKASTKNKNSNGSDIINKVESDLPNQVQTP